MITEQELELALSLRNEIKDLKTTIAKLENVVISSTQSLSNGVSMDSVKIVANEYTKTILITFKEEIVNAHRLKLLDLKNKYKEIVESPSETLRRVIEENG